MKKKKLIVSIVAVLVVAVAVLTVLLLWPKKNNKQVYSDAVKESFSFVTKADSKAGALIETMQDVIANKIIKIAIEGRGAFDFGNIELYSKEGNFYGLANIDAEGKKLSGDGMFKDGKFYFTIKDVLNGYYYLDENDANLEDYVGPYLNGGDFDLSEFNLDIDLDFQKVAELLVDSLVSSIDDSNVEKESGSVTINSKKYDADKYSYTYTGKDLQKAINNFVDGLKKDKKLYGQFEDLLEKFGSDESLDDILDELVESTDELKDVKEIITYTIYMYKDEVISTQISVAGLPAKLVINHIDDEYFEAYVNVQGKKLINLTVTSESKNEKSFELFVQEEKILTGSIEHEDDEITFEVNVVESEMIPAKVKLSGTIKKISEFEYDCNFKLDGKADGEPVNGEVVVKIREVDEMPDIDVSRAKPYSQMSDTEKKALDSLGFEF